MVSQKKVNNWKDKKAVIIIHESTTGPGHDLRDYLLQQGISKLLFVAHPLLYIPANFRNASRYELYINGKLYKKNTGKYIKLPEYLLYIKDTLFSLYWIFHYMGFHDLFVGVGNLDAFLGVILHKIGIAKRTIYYVIDYVPNRFKNKSINQLYHWIEKTSALYSDWTWNLSPRMINTREKKWKRTFPHQLVVSHGVHFDRIKRLPFSKIHRYEIIFMGTLLKKQGVQIVIKAISIIKKQIPEISFAIIGDGPFSSELKKLAQELNVQSHIEFLGYVKNHRDVENRIAQAALAVALYKKNGDDFTYFADPGKIRNYLGAGVPVLLTDIPYIAKEIEQKKCGMIISYNVENVATTIIKILQNEKKLLLYRKNAQEFAQTFRWEHLFSNALSKKSLLQ